VESRHRKRSGKISLSSDTSSNHSGSNISNNENTIDVSSHLISISSDKTLHVKKSIETFEFKEEGNYIEKERNNYKYKTSTTMPILSTRRKTRSQSKRNPNTNNADDDSSTPGATRTRRTGTRVRPIGDIPKDSEDFEDVDAFWATSRDDSPAGNSSSGGSKASYLISGSRSIDERDRTNGPLDGNKVEEKRTDAKRNRNEKREALRKQKREEQRARLAEERANYERTIRDMPRPNFRIGLVEQSVSKSERLKNDGGSSNLKDRKNFIGSWTSNTISENRMTGGAMSSLPSPSDLSRVSTIPPTPATAASSTNSHRTKVTTPGGMTLHLKNPSPNVPGSNSSRLSGFTAMEGQNERSIVLKDQGSSNIDLESIGQEEVKKNDPPGIYDNSTSLVPMALSPGTTPQHEQKENDQSDVDEIHPDEELNMENIVHDNDDHNDQNDLFPTQEKPNHSNLYTEIRNTMPQHDLKETSFSSPRPSNSFLRGSGRKKNPLQHAAALLPPGPDNNTIDHSREGLATQDEEEDKTPQLEASLEEMLNNTAEDAAKLGDENYASYVVASHSLAASNLPDPTNNPKVVTLSLDDRNDKTNTLSKDDNGDDVNKLTKNQSLELNHPNQSNYDNNADENSFDDNDDNEGFGFQMASPMNTSEGMGMDEENYDTNISTVNDYQDDGLIKQNDSKLIEIDPKNVNLSEDQDQDDKEKSVVNSSLVGQNVSVVSKNSLVILDSTSDRIDTGRQILTKPSPTNSILSERKKGQPRKSLINNADVDISNDVNVSNDVLMESHNDISSPELASKERSEESPDSTKTHSVINEDILNSNETPNANQSRLSNLGESDHFENLSPNSIIETKGTGKKSKANSKSQSKKLSSVLKTPERQTRRLSTSTGKRVRYATPPVRGYAVGNREYNPVPVTEYKDMDGTRRSKRARFPVLAFWKNERLVYEAHNEEGDLGEALGDMPVVTKVIKALPTPYKRKNMMKRKDSSNNRKKINKMEDSKENNSKKDTPFDASKLRRKYDVKDGESANVWNEGERATENQRVICFNENMAGVELPINGKRSKGESKNVGRASQAFSVPPDRKGVLPGWIAGNLVLPPRAIKDAEGVGLCSQVFNVGDCQPQSLEFSIADPEKNDGIFDVQTAQRFLLSKGDMFHVPAGNIYRIENHSRTKECALFWTIIRPIKGSKDHVDEKHHDEHERSEEGDAIEDFDLV